LFDDPKIIADILHRLRVLNPKPKPKYNPTPSRLRASLSTKEWAKRNPERRRLLVKRYEKRKPELKQARKAKYRSRLRNAGGSFTHEQWEERKKEFGNRCAYCGKKSKLLTPDHYIPLSKGGTNYIDNIVPACPQCNRTKWNKDPSKFDFPRKTQMLFSILYKDKKDINEIE